MDWIGGGSGVAECATVGTLGTGVRSVVGTAVGASVFTVVGTDVVTVVGDEGGDLIIASPCVGPDDGVFVTVIGVVLGD